MSLLQGLTQGRGYHIKGEIYHRLQIDFAYHTNRIEGSRLSEEQTRYIYETHSLGGNGEDFIPVDDIMETLNHFEAFDFMLDTVMDDLSEEWFKTVHKRLKQNTQQAKLSFYNIGDYKSRPNIIGDRETTPPEKVAQEMRDLLASYQAKAGLTLDDILDFHVRFERIHPFSDGNGRVGRLVMFKECLRLNITPFIITDDVKPYYYRGLSEWEDTNGYLRDTCLSCQDRMTAYLDYFRVD